MKIDVLRAVRDAFRGADVFGERAAARRLLGRKRARARDPEKLREIRRRYEDRHADERRVSVALWRAANPERVREINRAAGRRYRAKLSDAQWSALAGAAKS